jgi:hypothetical protein
MQMQKSNYAKVKVNLWKVKVNLDNYRFYLPSRVWNFKSAEPDFSSFIYSSSASVGLGDGETDGCTL